MSTTFSKVANDKGSTLTTDHVIGDGQLIVASVAGFPATPFRVSVGESIFNITNVVGNILTIGSTIEGTTDQNYSASTEINVNFTAGHLQEIHNAINSLEKGVSAIISDTDSPTITFDCNVSHKHSVTLAGNRTLALSNAQVGQTIMIILRQDGTGSRTVTWWSGILWANGVVPTLTTTPAKRDVFNFVKTGEAEYLGFISGLNF